MIERGRRVASTILAVDDDETLLRFLQDYLQREGFTVLTANRGQKALRLFYKERPDLVLLDVMMPGMDGWEVCNRIRELADTPIILLTAKKSEVDKLRGFRLGVDDYVTKPFSLAELTARIGAVLTRAAPRIEMDASLIQAGELEVDLRRHEARLDGRMLALTPTEFRLLAMLIKRRGEAISRVELINEVWGEYRQKGGSALRRYIWFLRRKIEDDPEKPERLQTVRGYGYRLEV